MTFIYQNLLITAVFLGIYMLLYRHNRYLIMNRVILMLSLMLSVMIPFIEIEMWPIELPDITVKSGIVESQTPVLESVGASSSALDYTHFYFMVVACLLLFFTLNLWSIWRNIRKSIPFSNIGKVKVYKISEHHAAHSFLNHIFISDADDDHVKYHELAHARYFHTLDLIILHIFHCFLWFNPLMFLYSKLLRENHEFSADRYAMHKSGMHTSELGHFLLSRVQSKSQSYYALTNNFNSLLKQRIMYLSKNRKSSLLIYLLVLPMIYMAFSSFTFKEYYVAKKGESNMVIDTIPKIVVDTIIVFDPETKIEKTVIVNNFSIEDYIQKFDFSGKMLEAIDTVAYFDPNTMSESIGIYQYKYPIEIVKDIPKLMELGYYMDVIEQVGDGFTLEARCKKDEKHIKIYLMKNSSFMIYDSENHLIKTVFKQENLNSIPINELNLSPGKYTITYDSSGKQGKLEIN